jgi:hypothetical protein
LLKRIHKQWLDAEIEWFNKNDFKEEEVARFINKLVEDFFKEFTVKGNVKVKEYIKLKVNNNG